MPKTTHCLSLLDELLTTINAVFVPASPHLRMLFLTALLGEKVSVYHFTALRAVTNRWACAPVIQIWTGVLLHFCFLLSIQIYEFSGISTIFVRSSFLLEGIGKSLDDHCLADAQLLDQGQVHACVLVNQLGVAV